jgi:hypothetical protein
MMKPRKLLALTGFILSPLVIVAVSLRIPDLLAVLGLILLTQAEAPATRLIGIFLLIRLFVGGYALLVGAQLLTF